MRKLAILILGLILFLSGLAGGYYFFLARSAPKNCPLPAAPVGFKTYSNAQFGLEISYPDQAEFMTDKNQMALSGYIPACDPTSAFACVLYTPKEIFSKTNFESAGLSLNSYPDRLSEPACLALANGEMNQTIEQYNGVKFSVASFGDAAAGHQSTGVNYRTFHRGSCLELAKRINTTTFENYSPGAIEKFTDADRQLLHNIFNDIFSTLKFND